MKNMFLALVAFMVLGLSVVGTAQADVIDDTHLTGTLGAQTNFLYRGVEDNRETPVVLGTVQAQYRFARLGLKMRTTTMDTNDALVHGDVYGEVFHVLAGHELKLGVGTDEMPGSSTETYVGAKGPLPLPWDLKYDLTVSRSNQMGDVWVDGGVSKTFGYLTLRGGAAGGVYNETNYHNGVEFVNASAAYSLAKVRHFENAALNLTLTHNTDEHNIVRGIRTDRDTTATAGIVFTF